MAIGCAREVTATHALTLPPLLDLAAHLAVHEAEEDCHEYALKHKYTHIVLCMYEYM